MRNTILKLILIFLFLQLGIFAQSYYFAWFTDTHIGSPTGEQDLLSCIQSVNKRSEIKFVIVTGDVTEKGRNDELIKAKQILDQLKVKYYIIPGNHDTKWSESFCSKFPELFGDDKFMFDDNGIRHIGLNSGIVWRGGGGHITPEDLHWLDSLMRVTPLTKPIFLYTHHPLDGDVDNWFKVIDLIKEHNVRAILYGHGHANTQKIIAGLPAFMSRSTLKKKNWGYTLCKTEQDSLFLSEISGDTLFAPWAATGLSNKVSIQSKDSLQFIDTTSMLLWKKDLSTTHSVSPLIEGDQIITADIHGIVRAFGLQGNEMWKFDAHGSIAGRPAAAMGLLAIATTKGDIYTLDIISGRVRSNIGVDEIFTGQLSLFATQYRDEPTIAILLGTASGKMLCYDLFYLDEIWRNENATEMIETKPLVVNDRIIYGSRDGYLYCIDATTGQLNWRWSDSKNFYFSPAACYPVTDSSAVYIAAPDNYVTKIDLLLGKPEWRKKDFNAWESIGISPDKQKIYVKSLQNKFYIVKTDSGGLLYADSLGFGVDTVPIEINSVNDTIIIGSKNGSIYLILNSAFRKLFFIGTSRILSTVHWKNTIYTALNMDGTLVVFDIAKRK